MAKVSKAEIAESLEVWSPGSWRGKQSPKDMNSLRFLRLCVLLIMSPGWRRQPIITLTYGSIIER